VKIKFGIDPTSLPSFLAGEVVIAKELNAPDVVMVECDSSEVGFRQSEEVIDRRVWVKRVKKFDLPPMTG
jgi:hypothetical protein